MIVGIAGDFRRTFAAGETDFGSCQVWGCTGHVVQC